MTVTAEEDVPPGVIFCLRAEGEAEENQHVPDYPLAPHYLVHVGEDGSLLLPFTQAKAVLDRLKRLCVGQRHAPMSQPGTASMRPPAEDETCGRPSAYSLLPVSSIVGASEERAVASLFTPGGTYALAEEFIGMDDFEVVAFLVVLPEEYGMTVFDPYRALALPPETPGGPPRAQDAVDRERRVRRGRSASYPRRESSNLGGSRR